MPSISVMISLFTSEMMSKKCIQNINLFHCCTLTWFAFIQLFASRPFADSFSIESIAFLVKLIWFILHQFVSQQFTIQIQWPVFVVAIVVAVDVIFRHPIVIKDKKICFHICFVMFWNVQSGVVWFVATQTQTHTLDRPFLFILLLSIKHMHTFLSSLSLSLQLCYKNS